MLLSKLMSRSLTIFVIVLQSITLPLLLLCGDRILQVAARSTRTVYQLAEVAVEDAALSITSFSYNADSAGPPVWVPRIMGSQAVYWNMTDGRVMFHKDIRNAQNNFQAGIRELNKQQGQQFQLRDTGATTFDGIDRHWPMCSIEMLGFARLNREAPFRGLADRFNGPSMGTARLIPTPSQYASTSIRSLSWDCFYRALYLNYKDSDPLDSFWAVVFYCPADVEAELCDSFARLHNNADNKSPSPIVPMRLDVDLRNGRSWSTTLRTTAVSAPAVTASAADAGMALCTVWPYATSSDNKLKSNEAMIFEFIRYYSNLGVRMFVYDRDGINIGRVAASGYARAHSSSDESAKKLGADMKRLLHYHDYTIESLLMNKGNIRSDNENTTKSMVWQMDHDKELTYTHCRFEAKAKYGITRVLVIDYDEFLYCKAASPDPGSQRAFLQQLLYGTNGIVAGGLEQLLLGQAWVASRAHSPHSTSALACVDKQIAAAESRYSEALERVPSIFDCFSSVRHVTYVPYSKSLHLQHVCPYTSMHHACGGCFGSPRHLCSRREQNVRVYDCLCNSDATRACLLVHLSLVESGYHGHREFDHPQAAALPSELWQIANARS